MPSLKDVKMKIVGVRKTKQITKAMNMVASAKLRGAQSRIERFRPYAEKFQAVLGDLAAKSDGSAHALLERRAECHVSVIILATSDRGLCGGFNAMLIAKALDAGRRRPKEKPSSSSAWVKKDATLSARPALKSCRRMRMSWAASTSPLLPVSVRMW